MGDSGPDRAHGGTGSQRYAEPKQRSAELLRLTLSHMGRHAAAFNPLTFTLWYEYVAGINPRLAEAVDAWLARGQAIDDDAVLQICEQHVFPPDLHAVDRLRIEMLKLMSGVAHTARQTSHRAGTFGEQLSGLTQALTTSDTGLIGSQLHEVLAGTSEMKQSIDTLQSKVASSQEEIDRLRADLERARGEALMDPLTGILNRKGFDLRLQELLAQPGSPGTPHCVAMLDIDHFKKVNDTHGHLMGDQVLQAVGEILRRSVSQPAIAARYGGEEFAILLPRSTLAQSAQVAELVRARTKALKIRNRSTQEVLVTVTLSGGLASMAPGDDAQSLLARADAALYASKNSGRDRVTAV
jgi:diguanylate cyclase